MKIFITLLLLSYFFIDVSYCQESILPLKENAIEIDGSRSLDSWQHNSDQYRKFRDILTLNVYNFFGLESRYDTDLKKRVFEESAEFKELLKKLEVENNQLKESIYYVDFVPTYRERNNLQYDINSKSFTFLNLIREDQKTNSKNNFHLDKIIIRTTGSVTVSHKSIFRGGVNYDEQKLSLFIDELETAIKVEENRNSIRIFFLFQFTDAKSYQGVALGTIHYTSHHLFTNLINILLYDSSTNNILHIF